MLKTDRKRDRSILTLGGTITYSRYLYRGADENSRQYLLDHYHSNSICPIDDYLGTANLPFRMTSNAALKMARITLDCPNLAVAEDHVSDAFGEIVSDDRIRKVLLYIARLIRADMSAQAANLNSVCLPEKLTAGKRRGRPAKDAFNLCMEVSMVRDSIFICRTNTVSCGDGLTARKHVRYSFCSTEEYANILLTEALLHGVMDAREIIIIVDDNEILYRLCRKLFPSAHFIMGIRGLRKQVYALGTTVVKHFMNQKYRRELFCKQAMKHIESGNWEKIFTMDEVLNRADDPEINSAINDFQTYLVKHKELLSYSDFQAKGYPIGKDCPTKEQAAFEKNKLTLGTRLWPKDSISDYLLLYSKYLSGDWYSYVVPLVRENYAKYRQ